MEYKPETKQCQNCKKDFIIEIDDFSFYEKIKVPPPTWCPTCRFQRRCTFRNERKLFRNIDAISKKPVLSLYPPEAGFPIYEDSYWWSDNWDPCDYGVSFDRSKPFLLQLYQLSKRVPFMRSDAVRMVRSEYSANASDLKDCYLIFNSSGTENSAYGNAVDYCKNVFDNSHIQSSEKCYESFWLNKCYDTHFSSLCEECVSVWFCKNCQGCMNCFGCVNLRNKSYCIWNEQYTKDEYFEKIKSFNPYKWADLNNLKKEVKNFWLDFPNKYSQGVRNNSCSGDYISNSKNVKNSYLIREGQDLKYVQYGLVPSLRDCMDLSVSGNNSELIYESVTSGWNSSNMKFCVECWDGGSDFEYSIFCGKKASHVFGSVGIKSGEYVILNKKYSKEEFYRLKEEIIQHMNDMPYIDNKDRVYKYGEFFPPEFSPFAYNDTISPEHFPLSKNEILEYGANWYEVPKSEYDITIKAKDLPSDINDAHDDILGEVISCEDCGRAYKIIQTELQFLKQNNIALPRYCINCRHDQRISQRNRNKLYKRVCGCSGEISSNGKYKNEVVHDHKNNPCTNEFETSYAPERPEIVYCEKCYQQEVY